MAWTGRFTKDQQVEYDKLSKENRFFVDALLLGAPPDKAYLKAKKKAKHKAAKLVHRQAYLKHIAPDVDSFLAMVAPNLQFKNIDPDKSVSIADKKHHMWHATYHGPRKKFEYPGEIWEAAVEYFEYVTENPLHETKSYSFKGSTHTGQIPKMRPFTIRGLCLFLEITEPSWYNYKSRAEYADIMQRIEDVIDTQKFEGAAADLLNPMIISRDLGLKEASEISGPGGRPIGFDDMTQLSDAQLEDRIAKFTGNK